MENELHQPKYHRIFCKFLFFFHRYPLAHLHPDFAFEPIAKELLGSNPQLKSEFEEAKENDSALRNNHMAQLFWVFKRSQFYEPEHKRYPIMRVF